MNPLARPRQRRGEEHAHEQDEQNVAHHEQDDQRDDGQDREEQPKINRQRPVDGRLTGTARLRHLDRIPGKWRCYSLGRHRIHEESTQELRELCDLLASFR